MEKFCPFRKKDHENAQGMLEFALIVPLLLVLIFGIMEFGRLFAMLISVYSASREAARYGAAAGDNGSGTPYFRDCQGIRDAAIRVGVMAVSNPNQIDIRYDHGPSSAAWNTLPGCPADIGLGDRIRVRVTSNFVPVVPLIGIPSIPISAESSRTLIREVDVKGKIPASPTFKFTRTATLTRTPTPTHTATMTPTNTPTLTSTPTQTPTQTATATETPTPSDTPVITPIGTNIIILTQITATPLTPVPTKTTAAPTSAPTRTPEGWCPPIEQGGCQ